MNRRSFLRGWGAAVGYGIVTPMYFLAPAGGWLRRIRCPEDPFGTYTYDMYNNGLMTPTEFSEGMLEDILLQMRKELNGRSVVVRPTQLLVHPSWIGTPELEAYRRSQGLT